MSNESKLIEYFYKNGKIKDKYYYQLVDGDINLRYQQQKKEILDKIRQQQKETDEALTAAAKPIIEKAIEELLNGFK